MGLSEKIPVSALAEHGKDDRTMDFSEYIRPELLTLIPVLNLAGMFTKKAALFQAKYIPISLGIAGILLGAAYAGIFPKAECNMLQNILMGMLQGLLCAGMAVYGHQMSKQMKKEESAQEKN
jgi:hypothetical protein